MLFNRNSRLWFGRRFLGFLLLGMPCSGLLAQELLPELELPPQAPSPIIIPADGNEFGEALLRGPVHEAFAELHQLDAVPGMIVAQRPPELVEEALPDMRPQGRNIEWIPGYWAFDDEAADFIWISGIWREVPPGFRWLPGYWYELENAEGYQWISGSWVSEGTNELRYLPEIPPVTLERGPVGFAPSMEHIWVPGHWTWQERSYAWRSGYWSMGQENWVWIPARYHWTPRGHVFCQGYWDYPLARRGWLFSPYRFHRPFFDRPGRVFTPQVIVAIDLMPRHLWVRPSNSHYYFGDYYDNFDGRGFVPWHHWAVSGRRGVEINVNFNNPRSFYCGYDPLFHHFSRTTVIQQVNVTQVHQQINYFNDFDQRFQNLQVERDHRPSRHLRDYHAQAQRGDLPNHDMLQTSLGRTMEQHRNVVGRERVRELSTDRVANQAAMQISQHRAVARQEAERQRPSPSDRIDSTDRASDRSSGRSSDRNVGRIPGQVQRDRSTTRESSDQPRSAEQRNADDLQRRAAVQDALRRGSGIGGGDSRRPTDRSDVTPEAGQRIRPGTTEAELRSWVENHQRRIGTDPRTARELAEQLVPPGSASGNNRGNANPTIGDPQRGRGQERPRSPSSPRSLDRSNVWPQREAMPQREVLPQRETLPQREVLPRREAVPQRDISPQRETTPRRDITPQREVTPRREVVPQREATPRREVLPPREATPRREVVPQREATPRREVLPQREASPRREAVPQREALPQREVVPRREALPQREIMPQREAMPRREVVPQRDVVPQREASPRREPTTSRDVAPRNNPSPRRESPTGRTAAPRNEGSPERGQTARGENSRRGSPK